MLQMLRPQIYLMNRGVTKYLQKVDTLPLNQKVVDNRDGANTEHN